MTVRRRGGLLLLLVAFAALFGPSSAYADSWVQWDSGRSFQTVKVYPDFVMPDRLRLRIEQGFARVITLSLDGSVLFSYTGTSLIDVTVNGSQGAVGDLTVSVVQTSFGTYYDYVIWGQNDYIVGAACSHWACGGNGISAFTPQLLWGPINEFLTSPVVSFSITTVVGLSIGAMLIRGALFVASHMAGHASPVSGSPLQVSTSPMSLPGPGSMGGAGGGGRFGGPSGGPVGSGALGMGIAGRAGRAMAGSLAVASAAGSRGGSAVAAGGDYEDLADIEEESAHAAEYEAHQIDGEIAASDDYEEYAARRFVSVDGEWVDTQTGEMFDDASELRSHLSTIQGGGLTEGDDEESTDDYYARLDRELEQYRGSYMGDPDID